MSYTLKTFLYECSGVKKFYSMNYQIHLHISCSTVSTFAYVHCVEGNVLCPVGKCAGQSTIPCMQKWRKFDFWPNYLFPGCLAVISLLQLGGDLHLSLFQSSWGGFQDPKGSLSQSISSAIIASANREMHAEHA